MVGKIRSWWRTYVRWLEHLRVTEWDEIDPETGETFHHRVEEVRVFAPVIAWMLPLTIIGTIAVVVVAIINR